MAKLAMHQSDTLLFIFTMHILIKNGRELGERLDLLFIQDDNFLCLVKYWFCHHTNEKVMDVVY